MADSKIHEIDFIKGLAILSVILLHTVSSDLLYKTYAFFHIWQAVPIFIFISYYLLFVKLDRCPDIASYFSIANVKKVIRRIVLPFALIELLIIAIYVLFSLSMSAKGIIVNGGAGPGSYYPYVYVQLWISAPFIYYILRNVKSGGGNFICHISGFKRSCLLLRSQR